ncbi:MAG: NAD(P)-binding protein, partial [Anaerolineae bacterium]
MTEVSPMETYDVIIVGAGPAGLSTALHLQQMSPDLASRTVILEKARHPR